MRVGIFSDKNIVRGLLFRHLDPLSIRSMRLVCCEWAATVGLPDQYIVPEDIHNAIVEGYSKMFEACLARKSSKWKDPVRTPHYYSYGERMRKIMRVAIKADDDIAVHWIIEHANCHLMYSDIAMEAIASDLGMRVLSSLGAHLGSQSAKQRLFWTFVN